jgi:hypothetical protein
VFVTYLFLLRCLFKERSHKIIYFYLVEVLRETCDANERASPVKIGFILFLLSFVATSIGFHVGVVLPLYIMRMLPWSTSNRKHCERSGSISGFPSVKFSSDLMCRDVQLVFELFDQ